MYSCVSARKQIVGWYQRMLGEIPIELSGMHIVSPRVHTGWKEKYVRNLLGYLPKYCSKLELAQYSQTLAGAENKFRSNFCSDTCVKPPHQAKGHHGFLSTGVWLTPLSVLPTLHVGLEEKENNPPHISTERPSSSSFL